MAADLARFGGAVLTGGASRRMGRDKALIELDGRPLAVRVAAALAEAGAVPVVCVGGDTGALTAAGLAAVDDLHPGEGPLGGVLTALHAVPTDVVVVLSTDLARPTAAAVRAVAAALGDDDDLAVAVVDGRRQWLHAAWRRGAEPALRTAFDAGERSIHGAIGALRVREVASLPAWAVADLDEPADLTALTDRN